MPQYWPGNPGSRATGPTGPAGTGLTGPTGPTGPDPIVEVTHRTDGAMARPAGAEVVYWYGSATPFNAQPYDFWRDEAPPPVAFNAELYDTPTEWWSANSITGPNTVPASGAAVTSWASSKSSGGSGHHLVSSSPTTYNSGGWVDFASGYMTSNNAPTRPNDYTCYILLYATGSTQMGYFSADGNTRWWQLRVHTDNVLRIEPFTGSPGTHQGSMSTAAGVGLKSQWVVYTMVRSAAVGTVLRQNGTQVLNNAAATPGAGGSSRTLLVGYDYDPNNDPYTGRIKEVVMYPTGHDTTTMATIEAALLATVV